MGNFKKKQKLIVIFSIIVFIILFLSFAFSERKRLMEIEAQGIEMFIQGEYVEAIETFQKIPDYLNYHNVEKYYNMCLEKLKDKQELIFCPHCNNLILEE